MKRRIALTALAGLLTTVTLAGGMGISASASTTPDLRCDLVYRFTTPPGVAREQALTLFASAVYVDNVDGPGIRTWTQFRFRLEGFSTTHNNVNIRLTESGQTIYSWNSPDDLRSGQQYIRNVNVHSSAWGPLGERDHRSHDLIEFEGIFDIPGADDVSCTASTNV